MKKHVVFILLFFIFSFQSITCLKGQTNLWSYNWMDYLEEMAIDSEDENQLETFYTELSYMADHPMDLNNVTKEELRHLPFLSDRQSDDIILYKKKYGKWASVYELKNIESLDFKTISLLLPFVFVGDWRQERMPFTLKNLIKKGQNELLIRYDRGLQQKKGYKYQPDSVLQKYPNRKYMGEPYYHSVRYSYMFDKRFQFGLVGEKDYGEPFFSKRTKGYDFYSFHLFLKDIGKLKALALGDYKVSFGQGLVVNTNLSFWKTTLMLQPELRYNGFKPHYSTSEANFFRGLASSFSFGKVDVNLFYSHRGMDATVKNNHITSLATDGYHRLPREVDKRNAFMMLVVGGNMRYASPDFCVGLTVMEYKYGNMRMDPTPKPYNLYYFRGNKNENASVDYLWKGSFLKFYGETAFSANKALATMNGVQFTPFSYLTGLIMYRNYGKRYQSLFGNSYSQNTSVQNEEGLYLGVSCMPFSYWKFLMYMDYFRFPWLKYGVDAPSKGCEYKVQADYSKNDKSVAVINYTYKKKEKNGDKKEDGSVDVLPYYQHKVCLQFDYRLSPSLTMRSSFEGNSFVNTNKKSNNGWIISQGEEWKVKEIPLKFTLYMAYFKSDNYDSRVYSREKNLLYAFSLPSFYGEGMRYSSVFHWDICRRLDLSLKISWTHYFDRSLIGTDLEEIQGRDKVDFNCFLKYKF